ncbi:hypothetical protein XENOCAPTIV_014479, partial [Xenoophorus captivus]
GPGRVVNGAFMVLKGHRSIVNQVRFNPHSYMICSSGVEKVIKVWSPYLQPGSEGDLEGRVEDKSRSLYSHEEYISLVLNSGSGLSHDYVSQSIEEDPRMMAFFDSLVRREIEGWSSDSDSDLSEEAIMQLHARGRRTTRATSAAPAAASAADHHSDSDNSSSSSLAGPDASGGQEQAGEDGEECPRRQRRRQQHQSSFLVNEDSDSSEFWLDPMPRPRSPSPRENSTLSSPSSSPSLPARASSSSTSTSSSSSDDEERRSAVRRQNVMRRCRMNVVSRAGNRPESIQALFSAIDSYGYPSISVDDLASSSSEEEQNSLEIKTPASGSREEEKCLSPSDFVCPSPVMSPGSEDNNGSDRTEQEGHPAASPLLLEACRTEGVEPALGSPENGEANDSSTVADGISQSRRSPGANGQHRPVTPAKQQVSSESEEETGAIPEDSRPQREKGLAQSALKRTHVGSDEGELDLSPSEKKLKT